MCVELYQNQVKTECVIKTGSALDSLLAGGFKTGSVYEVYGLPGVGKSQLCMSLAVSCSLEHGKQSVLYIDTKNDLSPERMLEILQELKYPCFFSLLSFLNGFLTYHTIDGHFIDNKIIDITLLKYRIIWWLNTG